MDFIERWFGFAPDNGDGTFELLIVATVVAVVVIAGIWRFAPRWSQARRAKALSRRD